MIERVSARVIVIDERSRVLLVSSRDPDDGRLVWYSPGGGLEPGGSLEAAARREMKEELHFEVGDVTGPIWERRFPHTFAGTRVNAHAWFFLARVQASCIRDVAETGVGARYFEGWRWWTAEELADYDGILGPGRLPWLFASLLAGDVPSTPLLLTD